MRDLKNFHSPFTPLRPVDVDHALIDVIRISVKMRMPSGKREENDPTIFSLKFTMEIPTHTCCGRRSVEVWRTSDKLHFSLLEKSN